MNAHSPWTPWFTPSDAPTEDTGVAIGDIVYLITGSPDMVVTDACECGEVTVAWYDDHNGMNVESFPEEVLVYV